MTFNARSSSGDRPDISARSSAPRTSEHAPSILYVTEGLHRGGTEGHLAKIAPAMQTAGWDVSVFCLSDVGPLAAELERHGISVIGPPISELSKTSALFPLRIGFVAAKLLWILLRRNPTVVHFFLPGPYLVGAPLAVATRVQVRIMSRRSLNHYQEHWPLARAIEPYLHQYMTAILANSRSILLELTEEEGCDARRLGLIYNGVDLPTYTKAEPVDLTLLLGRPRPALVLITVANLIPYKGHTDLIDALSGVADRLPQPWVLLCVGADFGIGESLREQTRRLGLLDNVRLLGEREDVASLLLASDVALLCSHQEGFANVILEAMATGLPVIATDVGGNAEAVEDGVTGCIVPPHDPSSLGKAILELAIDSEKRVAMGRRGRQRASAMFSLDTCISNYAALYRALLLGDEVGDVDGVSVTKLS